MKLRNLYKNIGKGLFILLILMQSVEAMMRFMPIEQLVSASEYIVIARVKTIVETDKIMQRRGVSAKVVKNELQVIESIKGVLSPEKPFILNTLKFNKWMEDNVELPPVGRKVLLFLRMNPEGKLKPVNGIQGVWTIRRDGKTRYGTLEEIQEMVQLQANSCKSEAFTFLIDTAEIQTQAGHYREALKMYRKAYRICPMRDLEEQMAWLMGEVGNEDGNNQDGRL